MARADEAMEKIVILSFDVERDCPPYLDTSEGIKHGLPHILDLLEEEKVRATFFTTGYIAERYPVLVRRIVDLGHELGAHGYRHERFDKIGLDEAERVLSKATQVLKGFYDVVSFRAPNLQLPEPYVKLLQKLGYYADSSTAIYKPPFRRGIEVFEEGIVRIPASITSSVLRLPWGLQRIVHKRLPWPIVYFSHPWEYIDMREKPVRFDCRFGTGVPALNNLKKLIRFHRERGAVFMTVREFAERILAKRLV